MKRIPSTVVYVLFFYVFQPEVSQRVNTTRQPITRNDGTWRIKTNEELEILIKKETIVRFVKITKIALGSKCNQNGHNKNCQKTTEWKPCSS